MHRQAEKMRLSMTTTLSEMFPPEENEDATINLVLTGFVLRPADDSDVGEVDEMDEPDDPEEKLWVFEAHFYAQSHPVFANVSQKLLLEWDFDTFDEAAAKLIEVAG